MNKKQALFQIERTLIKRHYIQLEHDPQIIVQNPAAVYGKHYIKNVALGLGIFAKPRRASFFVFNNEAFHNGLIIECIWINKNSTLEKTLPLLLYNIRKTAISTSIILDGEGVRPLVRKWLSAQATAPENRYIINVLTLAAFQRRVKEGFLP